MRVKVVKRFRDKHTRAIHEVGKEITINKDRYAEIKAAGKYVEPVEDDEEEHSANAEQNTATVGLAAQDADIDTVEPSLDDMSLAELKAYAKDHDVDLNGARTKATIADAIRAAEK